MKYQIKCLKADEFSICFSSVAGTESKELNIKKSNAKVNKSAACVSGYWEVIQIKLSFFGIKNEGVVAFFFSY